MSLSKSKKSRSGGLDGTSTASVQNLSQGFSHEVFFKMSKKIAQLTKVIYYLNSKHEDHDDEIEDVTEEYEDRIAEVVKELEDLKQEHERIRLLNVAHEEVIEANMERIRDLEQDGGHELAVKQQLRAQLNETLLKCENLQKICDQQAASLGIASGELRASQEGLHMKKSELEEKIASVYRDAELRFQEAEQRHKDEMEDLRVEMSKRMRLLAEERDKSEEMLRDSFELIKSKINEDLNNARQEVRRVKDQLEETEAQWKARYNAHDLLLSEKISQATRLISTQDDTIKALEANANRCEDRIRELEQDLVSKTSRLDATEQQLETAETKLYKMSGEYDIYKQKALSADSKIESLNNQIEMWVSKLKKSQEEVENGFQLIETKKAEIERLKADVAQNHSTITSLNESVRNLKTLKSDMENRMFIQKHDFQELQELHEKTKKQHEIDLTSALQTLEKNLNELHTKELQKCQAEWADKTQKALSEKDLQIRKAEQATVDTEKAYVEKLAIQTSVYDEQVRAFEAQIKRLQGEAEALQQELEKTHHIVQEKKIEIEKNQSKIEQLNDVINILEVDKSSLFQKVGETEKATRAAMQAKFAVEKVELEESIKNLHVFEMETLRRKMNDERDQAMATLINSMMNQNALEKAEVQKRHSDVLAGEARKIMERDKLIKSLRERVEAAQKRIDDMDKDTMLRFKDLKVALLKQFEAEKVDLNKEYHEKETQIKVSTTLAIAAIEKKYMLQIKELQEQQEKAIQELNMAHVNALENQRLELEAKRMNEIEAIHEANEKAVTDMAIRHKLELANIENQYTLSHEAELKSIQEANDNQIKIKEDEIKKAQGDVEARMMNEIKLQRDLDTLRKSAKLLQENLDVVTNQLKNLKADSQIAIDQLKADFDEEHKSKLDEIVEANIAEMQAMLKEFEQGQAFMKNKLSEKDQQLRDAAQKYEERESREEDVITIRELNKHVDQYKSQINSLQDQLEFYRRELNNRETNFNKIFNKPSLVANNLELATTNRAVKTNPFARSDLNLRKLPPLQRKLAPPNS